MGRHGACVALLLGGLSSSGGGSFLAGGGSLSFPSSDSEESESDSESDPTLGLAGLTFFLALAGL